MSRTPFKISLVHIHFMNMCMSMLFIDIRQICCNISNWRNVSEHNKPSFLLTFKGLLEWLGKLFISLPPFLALQGGQAALGNCSATTAAVPSYPAVKKNGLSMCAGFPGLSGRWEHECQKASWLNMFVQASGSSLAARYHSSCVTGSQNGHSEGLEVFLPFITC